METNILEIASWIAAVLAVPMTIAGWLLSSRSKSVQGKNGSIVAGGSIIIGQHPREATNHSNLAENDERKVKITTDTARFMYDDRLGPPMAQINVTNIGRRTVVVNCPYLGLSDGTKLSLHGADGAGEFPVRLKDGDVKSIRIGFLDIAAGLEQSQRSGKTKLIPSCEDTVGTIYEAEAVDFDIKEWPR